jgi:sugar phosphate isomerase/epimerase
MSSRREFLTSMAAGAGAAAIAPTWAATDDRPEIKSALNGPIGLQLYSLRDYLPKDVPGTLAKVRGMGFKEVESAGLAGLTVERFRAALDTAGLRCQSAHIGFERLDKDAPGAFAEAKVLGARGVVTAWIPHQGDVFTRDDAVKAAEAFNRFGKAAKEAGLRYAYHCHGYEFVPSAEGTLFDTLTGATDPGLVSFQIDVFHAFNGGGDPTRVIEKLKGRVTSLHLKDLRKGVVVKAGSAKGETADDVPVGTGQVDWPAVLKAAVKSGATLYYLEDESADPLAHIPQSVSYLAGLKL